MVRLFTIIIGHNFYKPVYLPNLVDVKVIRSRDSGRKAILNNIERKYVRGQKSLGLKNKSKLFRKLDERFKALFDDLEDIKRSKVLDVWKSTRNLRLFRMDQYALLRQIFVQAKPLYLRRVRHEGYRKRKRTVNRALQDEIPRYETIIDKFPKFWLDTSPENEVNPRTDEKALEPKFVLRGLRSKLKKECGQALIKAYLAGEIPTTKEKACTLDEMS